MLLKGNTYINKTFLFINLVLLFFILLTNPHCKEVSNSAASTKKAGLTNFYKVSDIVYRGAQPNAKGFKELNRMGIKTILNLRSFHSDRNLLKNTNLKYKHIHMKAWHGEKEDVIEALQIISDMKNQPVFVHCQHGADRTGLIIAMYRIVIEGWDKEKAIKEMTQGGFGHHKIWGNLIDFIRDADIQKIKKEIRQ